MAFDNFTVNIVSFPETAGVDWTLDNPSIVLTLVPDAGYSISAANFSATTPLPNYVSSVIFTQNGSNIDCVINYTVPSVMPSVDVLVSLCATGFAEATAVTVSGTIKDCGTSNIGLPKAGDLPTSYSGSGSWDSSQTVFTQSVIPLTGYFFQTEPILALSIGNPSDYTITNVKTYDSDNQLIQIVFTVVYKFPVANVTGDEICLTANAIPVYDPSVLITAYKFNTSPISAGSVTRSFTIYGIEGANFALTAEYTPGNVNIVNTSGTIDSTGISVVNVVFPASSVNRVYTFTLTGNLASTFDTNAGQTSTPIVYQYIQSTLGFVFSSSDSAITVGAADSRSYLPYSTNQAHTYTVSATSTGSFVLLNENGNWSNQALGNQPTEYNQSVVSQSFTINNLASPSTLTASVLVDVAFAGTADLISTLNLDNVLQGTLVPLTLNYGLSSTIACCSGVQGNFFVASGQTFLTATSILDASGNPAADGFYKQ